MTTATTFAHARLCQRRLDAACRRSRMARLTLSHKARELRAIRSGNAIAGPQYRGLHGNANALASWLAWNGELIRSALRASCASCARWGAPV